MSTSPAPTNEPIDPAPAPTNEPIVPAPAPAAAVPKTKYLVHHNILMQGISASTFNGDELMMESFRQTVALVIGVSETDIVHILARASKRRRLSDANCDVGYDVKVASKAEQTTMKQQMNTKMKDSVKFTTQLQTQMEDNHVVSVSSNSISADTTTNQATATAAPKDQPNEPNINDDGSSADTAAASGGNTKGGEDATGGIVGGVVGGLVVVALMVAAILVVRRRKNRRHFSNIDTRLSTIEGVELSMNPMDSGKNKNKLPAIALEEKPSQGLPCDVPGWEMYMDNASGQAFYTNTATGETTWNKPGNNGKQDGTIHFFNRLDRS